MRFTLDYVIDDLTSHEWTWWFDEAYGLVLDGFVVLGRATKRHTKKPVRWYARLDARNSTLKESEVPLDGLNRVRAMEHLVDRIQKLGVHTWSEVQARKGESR
jgi:hypothetical protein